MLLITTSVCSFGGVPLVLPEMEAPVPTITFPEGQFGDTRLGESELSALVA